MTILNIDMIVFTDNRRLEVFFCFLSFPFPVGSIYTIIKDVMVNAKTTPGGIKLSKME